MARRAINFQSIRSEGGLLPVDLLRRVIDPRSNLTGTRPEDYGLPQSERLNEVITQSWNRLRKHWTEFRAAALNLPEGEAGTGLTNDKWTLPLLRELGFGLLPTSPGPEVGGRTYAINRFFGPVPIHLVGCGLSLDRRAAGVRGAAAINPHGLVQEFVNRSPGHRWAVVSNGLRFRVLRDNQALSRQSFLEFDLEAMFAGEVFSDFVLLWLIAHATRFNPRDGGGPESCWLEDWTKLAEEQGTRALGDLRGGVERALQILGEGFTSNPKNTALRDALRTGRVPLIDFHGQLLRVVYRLIFLFVAEERTLDGQPLLHPRDSADAARTARERYATHYGTARLRDLGAKIKGSRHGDLWRQFRLLVGALSGDAKFAAARDHLALPALGSFLWSLDSTATLNDAELTNHDFLEALRNLAFTRQGKVLRPVDYKNLGAEELGGVYESLLALTPQISADGARFTFAEFAGNERKTSGSYYTSDSLVQALLDSALDPVVAEAIKGKTGAEAETAILSLKICDPAVGSGHFLVGAAHRLARHLARSRALAQGESEPSPVLYQHALRDVIGRCLYGVDINPMAAELCRVSLWLEALEPGKPLSFLDHHIRVGNSLLGATPELIAAGLPDDAFTAVEGDDKSFCAALKKRNRQEREGQQDMLHLMVAEPNAEYSSITSRIQSIDQTPDNTLDGIQSKTELFRRLLVSPEYRHRHQVADAWCAIFVWIKQGGTPCEPITTDDLRRLEIDAQALTATQRAEIARLSNQYQYFHWYLAFPEVFANGGFDCVLGNPPWDTMSPDAKEFFSSFDPSIRDQDKDGQDTIIKRLLEDSAIAHRWEQTRRGLFAAVHFIKDSGRYRLFAEGNLGKGDFNIYRMFVELALQTTKNGGFVSQFVPEGFYKGANAAAIRKSIFDGHQLQILFGFVNTRGVWFPSVHQQFEFCLYALKKLGRTESFQAAFRLNSYAGLRHAIAGSGLHLPISLITEFAPDALAVMEFSSQFEVDICRKIYAKYPKFGERLAGLPNRSYMREVDMGSDRDLFSEQPEGLPVFEGRMLNCYDYCVKGYGSGRGRSAEWIDLPFGSPDKAVRPQWRILRNMLPEKVLDRIRRYRIGFCDVVNPATEKCLIAAVIPPESVCGHSVPTMLFENEDPFYPFLWIGIANSLAMDFVVRKKVRLHMSYTVVDTLPFPRDISNTSSAFEIVWRTFALCAVGPEMAELRNNLGKCFDDRTADVDAEGPAVRERLAAEINVLVAQTVYELTRREMEYVLDPSDVLGADCDTETFSVLRNRELREFGEYRTRRLVLETWDRFDGRDTSVPGVIADRTIAP